VDGLLKNPLNYQGVDPAEVGRVHRLVLGKHSGTQAVRKIYHDLGIPLSRQQALAVLERVRIFVNHTKRPPDSLDLQTFYLDVCANDETMAGPLPFVSEDALNTSL
jgi:homocitrate synthase NifV